jgi:hypothetical protein
MELGQKIYTEIKSTISVQLYHIVKKSISLSLSKKINILIRNQIVNELSQHTTTNIKL